MTTWTCWKCETFIPAAELFVVVNQTSKERLGLHRACVSTLIRSLRKPVRVRIKNAIRRQRSA